MPRQPCTRGRGGWIDSYQEDKPVVRQTELVAAICSDAERYARERVRCDAAMARVSHTTLQALQDPCRLRIQGLAGESAVVLSCSLGPHIAALCRILIVHGQNTICSWIDALKVLEKLKAVECRLQSLLLVMKDHSVKDEVLQQVEFSMLLNQFQYPVVGILSQDFDFQPQFWPTSDQLTALLPSVKWEYMMESAQEWSIPQDKYDLQPLTVCVRSMQGRSLALVDIEWHGKELYVGRMQGGKKHGLGVTIKRSGNKFNGSFLNGMAHGWGVFYNRDGSVGPGLSWNVEMIQAAKRFL
eukprot:746981-Hanusia_phi.AAC.2